MTPTTKLIRGIGPAVTVLALAGCVSDDPASAGADRDRAQVLVVYDGYQQALETALLEGDDRAVALAAFAGEPLLGQTRASIRQMQQAGVIGRGRQQSSPRVVALKSKVATIEDCADISAWAVASISTGEPVPAPPEQPERFVVTSTAKVIDGKWYVVGTDGDWSRSC